MKTKTIPNALFFQQVEDYLAQDKQVRFPVKGRSMLPFLREGDVIELRRVQVTDLHVGQVVLANYEQGFILHRIVKMKGVSLHLAGDGNYHQVEEISRNAVIAAVVNAYRGEQNLNINTTYKKMLGIFWFKLRLLRRIGSKVKMK